MTPTSRSGTISCLKRAKSAPGAAGFDNTSFRITNELTSMVAAASIGNTPGSDKPRKPEIAKACQKAVTLKTASSNEKTTSPGRRTTRLGSGRHLLPLLQK